MTIYGRLLARALELGGAGLVALGDCLGKQSRAARAAGKNIKSLSAMVRHF